MKRLFSFLIKLAIGFLIILFLIFGLIKLTESKPTPVDPNPLIDKLSYSELTLEQKSEVLDKFIKGDLDPFHTQHLTSEFKLDQALKSRIKYPETLKKDDLMFIKYNSNIKDVEKGMLRTTGKFTSENKLGMAVKGSYEIEYVYTGKGIKIEKFVVE